MTNHEIFDAFAKAYNNFDSRPLIGETLEKFYADDFTKEFTDAIINTIRITERYKKLLVIGHRGCGKSTILNKVSEELKDDYHVVNFSASDELTMTDVQAIDILMVIFLKVISSMKDEGIDGFLTPFEKIMKIIKDNLKLSEVGIDLLKSVSFKIKIEHESRSAIRSAFRTQIEELQKNISHACSEIYRWTNKDLLIIIDDLDKLKSEFAEQIFFEEHHLLTMPETKIIYSFPLATYYSPSFMQISDKFSHLFIRLVNLYDIYGEYQNTSLSKLKKLALKRISKKLISDAALKMLIDKSGGLLRDLIQFMQDACQFAINKKVSLIDESIAEFVIDDKINDYYRLFDFPKYDKSAGIILETKFKEKIESEILTYLLIYLFVLEYRGKDGQIWYDLHPCLQEAVRRQKK